MPNNRRGPCSDKRQQRKLKRETKQAGNKKRRLQLKNDLRDNPE